MRRRPCRVHRLSRLGRAVLVGSVVLVPWTARVARTLPSTHPVSSWRSAWAGFDAGLCALMMSTAVVEWRSARVPAPLYAALSSLVLADAWFDVTLSEPGTERVGALVMALGWELPWAIALGSGAWRASSSSRTALVRSSRLSFPGVSNESARSSPRVPGRV